MINIEENGCQAGSPGPCYRVLIFARAQEPFITGLLRGDVFFILSVMEFLCHQMSFQCSPCRRVLGGALKPSPQIYRRRATCVSGGPAPGSLGAGSTGTVLWARGDLTQSLTHLLRERRGRTPGSEERGGTQRCVVFYLERDLRVLLAV